MLEYFCKEGRESLDYTVDFYRFLVGREAITAASAIITAPTVTDPDATLTITRVGYTKNQVAVWVTGGEGGIQYTITITIDTDKGRRKEQSFLLQTSGAGSAVTIVYVSDTTAVRYSRSAVTIVYVSDTTAAVRYSR